MANKPPAFQFYAKDWRSSPTIKAMNRKQRGVYIDLLAAAWDSEEPGTLPLPVELAAKIASIDVRSVRDLLSKFPRTFVELEAKLVNEKLRKQWQQISQFQQMAADRGRKGAAARWSEPMHEALLEPGSASASASAKSKPRALIARDLRLAKEAETAKEARVGTLPFPSDGAKGGSVRKDYLEFLQLRNTGRISRDVNWSKWEPLSEGERKRLLEMPGPVTVGRVEELEKQKA